MRDANGDLVSIVEHRDCSDAQLAIGEVNVSYYCFESGKLMDGLARLTPNASKGEYYLTDLVSMFRDAGDKVSALVKVQPGDSLGINSRLDLAMVSRAMQDRFQRALLNDGVSIVDPDNTWVEADVSVGTDTVIYPFSFIGQGATIGEGCRVGPFAHVKPGESCDDGAVVGPSVRMEVAAS